MIFYRKQRKGELKNKLDDGTSFWTWIIPDERV